MTPSPSPGSVPPAAPDDPDAPAAHADPVDSANTVDTVDSLVLHATDNGVSWLTLNRPDAMNAVTWDQRERLIGRLADASADPDIRAVVLTATGKGFCAGADLRGAPPAGERVAGDVARMIRGGAQRLITAVLDCEKPVIAAVNGTAAGLGAHLALACDLVLAAESARFIEVFVRRGLVPDGGGAYLLPRLIGPQRAKELLFFGDALSAAEAERLGLVNRVVPDGELAKTAREWADRLAAGPTRALALTKQLVNASLDADRSTAFAAEATAQEINMTTADAQEGVASFVARRRPTFRGR
ncbi:enoyl-CoA hydratase-related protein [Streptomyces platensis]|uniref:enoyl-CoA hydratase/isomerase family protein n=1 Tax=Streptomyces platensis TaxID=58346 RepID=UPI002E8034A7|nr:enoyl-CoA hydratase-related protein [Streptomyces platensis]WTI52845.1 enoyl-CoA hydratase-related protein [Streptomyces platensis]WUB81542.1 enoyl-CoA hydratase-related protein [Streptomyces platensis]